MTDHEHIHCEEVVAHLLIFLDGEIDPRRREQIDRHLQECRGCCSRAEFEMALHRKVAALGDEKAGSKLRRRIEELIDKF